MNQRVQKAAMLETRGREQRGEKEKKKKSVSRSKIRCTEPGEQKLLKDILFLIHYLSGWNKKTKETIEEDSRTQVCLPGFPRPCLHKERERCAQRRSLRASKLKTRLSNWLMEKSLPVFAARYRPYSFGYHPTDSLCRYFRVPTPHVFLHNVTSHW